MKKIINSLFICILLVSIVGCTSQEEKKEESKEEIIETSNIPKEYQDNGIFKDYYEEAYELLNTLTLEEKIGQTLLVRFNDNAINTQTEYQFGGFTFYAKDFKNKTKEDVINMINEVQKVSKIPILTAIDEEGGNVSRISNNPNLVNEPFKSPQELYKEGGFDAIEKDVINKILHCNDEYIRNIFIKWQNATFVYRSDTPIRDKYCTSVKGKIRYIIPLAKLDEKSYRINEISQLATKHIKEYLNIKHYKYKGFDFNFKPYDI